MDDDDDQFRLVSLHEYEDGLVPQFNIEINNDAVVMMNPKYKCQRKADWMNAPSLSWISMLIHGTLRSLVSLVVTFDSTTKAFLPYLSNVLIHAKSSGALALRYMLLCSYHPSQPHTHWIMYVR